MSVDKDDNDNEQKNIDTYKVLGDQMARLALNFENKEKTDENSFLITYDDLAGKAPNINPNPSLKTGGGETKNKGKVKFGQVIKANPPASKIETKKTGNKNRSNKNLVKPKIDNKQNDSEKKLPFINPSFKNSNTNFNVNSITNANTNSSRDKNNINNNIKSNINNTNTGIIQNKNSMNMNNSNYLNINNNDNNTNKVSNRNSNKNSNKNSAKNILRTNSNFSNNKNNIVANTNQVNFQTKPFIPKPSAKSSNNNTNSVNINKPNYINRPFNNNLNFNTKGSYSNNNNTISNSRSNNSNQNNVDSKNNETINSDDLENLEIEIVNPDDLEDDESNKSSINPFVLEQQKIINKKHLSLYEREKNNLKKKKNKLDKERKLIIQKKMNSLQPGPVINDNSHNLVSKMGEYVPIQERAAQIHSRHLTQIILNEELTRIERQNKEEKEMDDIKKKLKIRKYDEKQWDKFVESCFKWKEEVNYKRKAAEIFRNNMEKKVNYKPKINANSKNIMKRIQKGNNSVDDVFNRLYNDYEEHKERQKILYDENLPVFYPKINKFNYINKYVNKRKYNNPNNSYDRFITDERKDNFFLDSHNIINGDKIDTHRSKKSNKYVKKANKFVNKNKSNIIVANNKKSIEKYKGNKTYRPTHTTNNSTVGVNTEGNTMGYTNRYITTENPMPTETNQYYIPTNANNNYFYDDKIDEISENSKNNKKTNKNNYFSDLEGEENIIYNNNDNNNYFNPNSKNKNNNKNNKNKNNYDINNNNYANNNYEINDNNHNNYENNNNYDISPNNQNNYEDNNNYDNNYNNNNDSNNQNINSNNNNYNNDNNYNQNDNGEINNYNNNDNNNQVLEYFDNNNNIDNSNIKKDSRNKNKKNKNNKSSKKSNSLETYDINRSEEEKNNRKSDISNYSKISKNSENKKIISDRSNINCCIGTKEMFRNEELLKELNEAQIKNKERLENENQNDNEDSLYRLNIRDTTPEMIKENVVIPNYEKYNNFFDIEAIKEL